MMEHITARSKTRWDENRLLFWGIILTLIVMVTQDGVEPFVPLVFGSSLFLFLYQKKRLGDSLCFNHMTLPSFFMLMYMILVPFGAITTFEQMDHPIRHTYLLAMQSVFVTFPLGIVLANAVVKNPSRILRGYVGSQMEVTQNDLRFKPIFKILLLSAIPILLSYFLYSEYVQLIEVIRNYPTNIDVVTLKFAGVDDLPRVVQFAFELLRRFLLPLCALYAYLMSVATQKSGWRIAFPVLFVFTLFVSSLTLDRAPPLALIVMFILAYLLRQRKTQLTSIFKTRLLIIFVAAMTVGGFISVLQYQSEFDIQKIATDTWYVFSYRILQDAPYMASRAFEAFNDSSTFLYGSSMRILSVLPGFHYVESGTSINYAAAPVGFVADLWRNFGWFGVVAGTILIGFAYQMIQLKLFLRKTTLTVSLNVVLLVGCIWIIHGNVFGVMSTSVLLFGVLFSVLYSAGRKRLPRGQPQVALRQQA
jgi:oligosaccharide repeat unit polymerase